MSVERHPLSAQCRREYWISGADCAAAQRAVSLAVEELLTAIADDLDPAHEWSPRFWRMGLGSTLWALVSFVFDRVCDPAVPLDQRPTPNPADICFSARDLMLRLETGGSAPTWVSRAIAEGTAQGALAYVIDTCGALAINRRLGAGARSVRARNRLLSRARSWLLFWEGEGDIGHFAAPFSQFESLQLALRSRGRIRKMRCPERSSELRYDGSLRAGLACRLVAALQAGSPLAQLAAAPVAALAPTALVEQIDELRTWLARQHRPRVLATALGFERSPYFNALADRVGRAGGKLVGMQHGGCYGQTDPSWSESLENQIGDVFCTWGYRHQASHQPMPSLRLGQLRAAKVAARPFAGRALLAHNGYSGPVMGLSQVPHPRRERELDLALISGIEDAQAATPFTLTLRPYPRLGRDLLGEAWKNRSPQIRIEAPGGRLLVEHAQAHDLTIFSFPGATGFLEFMHLDMPAIIFCPQDICPIRTQAQPAFQALIDAGLYATDSQSFQAIIAQWLAQGNAWWRAPRRAAARARFRAEFAYTSDAAVAQWARFLCEYAASVNRH